MDANRIHPELSQIFHHLITCFVLALGMCHLTTLAVQTEPIFYRWSDGSLSLHLGSEIFDVHKQPLQGDFNHLFIRQGTGLQGQAVFRTKLSFRPHSTESFTHQKMTRCKCCINLFLRRGQTSCNVC